MGKRLSGASMNTTPKTLGQSSYLKYNIDPLNNDENHCFQNLGHSLWSISKKRNKLSQSNSCRKNSRKSNSKNSSNVLRSLSLKAPLNP